MQQTALSEDFEVEEPSSSLLPKPCPFCGRIDKLDTQFRQASNRNRPGCYDCAIYCRNCYSYGPRVKSEDLALSPLDLRHESPRTAMQEYMKGYALREWNKRR